ncbi:MAG: hypothetical protein WDZ79_03050 [Candidatus Paceibacterota bacterium]
MGRNFARIVIGVSAVVFVVAVGVLLFLDEGPSTVETRSVEPVSTSTDAETGNGTGDRGDDEGLAGSQTDPSVDADVFDPEKVQSSCVSQREQDLNERDHVAGTLLVAFASNVSYADARRIVEVEGAEIDDGENAEDQLEEQGWLTVLVAEGEEARYMCRFERYPEVRSVRANVEFKLHE